jgi:hypothetical protein
MLPFIGPEMVAALLHRCDETEESIVSMPSYERPQDNSVLAASLRVRCKGMVLIFRRRVRTVWRFGRFTPPTL